MLSQIRLSPTLFRSRTSPFSSLVSLSTSTSPTSFLTTPSRYFWWVTPVNTFFWRERHLSRACQGYQIIMRSRRREERRGQTYISVLLVDQLQVLVLVSQLGPVLDTDLQLHSDYHSSSSTKSSPPTCPASFLQRGNGVGSM